MSTRVCAGRRSEEHTSELQSHHDLVCRLLLEKKKKYMKCRDLNVRLLHHSVYVRVVSTSAEARVRYNSVDSHMSCPIPLFYFFFFFNDTATTEIYTLFPTRRSSD